MGQTIARAINLFSSSTSTTTPIHTPIPTPGPVEAEIHTDEDGAEEPVAVFPPENVEAFASPLQKALYGIHGIGHVDG
ncbi:hypothetical protein RhiJN_27002 [Ceratobasidium sp. AG-Ba]|nr:hypothetical protein RhiJN_27002 [Ceratobasidium sp. AG-Ba]